MELPKAERLTLDQATYCAMPNTDQVIQEEKDVAVTKAMLLLLSSKNNNAKKNFALHIHKETNQLIHTQPKQ